MHKKPVKVRHGTSGMQVRFKLYVNSSPGDNPAQSEICGHIGVSGNRPCRKCLVGGMQQVKETNTVYHSLFEVGNQCFSFLVLTGLKHPAWCCSFHWRNPLGRQVPGWNGLSGCCPACTGSANQERHQRFLHPILDWLSYSLCTNIAQGSPWMDYWQYPGRTAHLGAGAQKQYL